MKRNERGRPAEFSEGAVWRRIVGQAVPLTAAQLVMLLYNIVDRIYLGHMSGTGGLALTGVGLTFPVITLIMGFTALFGAGGVPLFSIARGAGNEERAGRILGNSFSLLLLSAAVLTAVCYAFNRPILFAFGASEESYVYAGAYLRVYLTGTAFSMLATGLGGYISAQGFAPVGMRAVVAGAAANIALDPLFIFGLHMGVAGAALASVIGQILSAGLVLAFLCGKKAVTPLRAKNAGLRKEIVLAITKLGVSNFIMQGTTCLVQVVCNTTLQRFGGDLYVGVMTVVNSVREIFVLPVNGLITGAQPVIGYNYGAGLNGRVKEGVRFNTLAGAAYTLAGWLLVMLFPKAWFGIFSNDAALTAAGVPMLRIYFLGFMFMALQFAGQSTFQALGDAKHAIFFSLLRKAVIVTPLALLLPRAGMGVTGVFAAEPISNALGGSACYLTMRLTVLKRLGEDVAAPEEHRTQPLKGDGEDV